MKRFARWNRLGGFILGAFACAVAAACGGETSSRAAADETTVTDSAGIRVVDNPMAPSETWTVSESPLFVVGWEPGDPEFTWIQSGRLMPDGGAIIGEFSSGSLYHLSEDGTLLDEWGRKGQGPGEYQALDAIEVHDDRILVSDNRQMRLTTLSLDGEVLDTRPLPGGAQHRLSSVMSNGRLLLVPGDGYGGIFETRPEWVFEEQEVLGVDLDSEAVDTLAILPHLKRWLGSRGGSPGPVHVKGRAGGFDEGFAWARSDRASVRWYDQSGQLMQIARWTEQPRELTQAMRDRSAERMRASFESSGLDEAFISAQLSELEAGYDRHEGPLPYWDELLVDHEGNVWLREFGFAGDRSTFWRVIGRDGMDRGRLDVRGSISILDVSDDRVLVVRTDEFDVPAVVMLELLKASR